MVLIPQAIEALLTVINLICNFDILQSTAPRIFLMFFFVWNMAKMDHQRRQKLPRWGEDGLQLGKNLTMDWSSYLASFVYVRCYQMQGCQSEEIVRFFYLSWFISSSIHRNTPHPEGAQQSSSFQRSFMTVFTCLNNWQLITCTQCSIFHLVSNKINISTGKLAPMPNSLLFFHHWDQSGRSWKFVFTGSNKFSLKTRQ